MKTRLLFIAYLALLVAACQSTSAPTSRPILLPSASTSIPAVSVTATSAAATSTLLPQRTTVSTITTPATAAATASGSGAFNIDLELLVSGLERPTYLTDASDDSGRLFVTEQPGRIRVIQLGCCSISLSSTLPIAFRPTPTSVACSAWFSRRITNPTGSSLCTMCANRTKL